MTRARAAWTALLVLLVVAPALSSCGGGDKQLLLGATTTVQDPGLLDALVQAFESDSGYHVKPIVQGSGQVIELARRGELDVIMTHSPADEQKLIDDGYTTSHTPYTRNYFEAAGPPGDPAGVGGAPDMTEAFKRIARSGAGFVSRGDGSGTNVRELALWKAAGIDPKGQGWYHESAAGQGQNILIANDKSAYTLSDSSTFTTLQQRVQLKVLLIDKKDPNVYSVTQLNHDKLPNVNVAGGKAWADFLTSAKGQQLIAEFGWDRYGAALFEPLLAP